MDSKFFTKKEENLRSKHLEGGEARALLAFRETHYCSPCALDFGKVPDELYR